MGGVIGGDGDRSRDPLPLGRADGGRVVQGPHHVDQLADDHPVPRPLWVESGGVGGRRHPCTYGLADRSGCQHLVPAVPQQRRDLETRVAGQRFGIDHQPRFPVGGQHIEIMQVAVQEPAIGGPVGREVGRERRGLAHQAMRDGRIGGKSGQLSRPPCAQVGQAGELGGGRPVQAWVEPRDDLACGQRVHARQVLGAGALQQQRAARRICAQQTNCAVTGPQPQRDVLVCRLRMRPANFQGCTLAVRRVYAEHDGALADAAIPVRAQVPLRQYRVQQRRQIAPPTLPGRRPTSRIPQFGGDYARDVTSRFWRVRIRTVAHLDHVANSACARRCRGTVAVRATSHGGGVGCAGSPWTTSTTAHPRGRSP